MKWDNNKLTEAKIGSEKGGNCTLLYNGIAQEIRLEAGEVKSIAY